MRPPTVVDSLEGRFAGGVVDENAMSPFQHVPDPLGSGVKDIHGKDVFTEGADEDIADISLTVLSDDEESPTHCEVY